MWHKVSNTLKHATWLQHKGWQGHSVLNETRWVGEWVSHWNRARATYQVHAFGELRGNTQKDTARTFFKFLSVIGVIAVVSFGHHLARSNKNRCRTKKNGRGRKQGSGEHLTLLLLLLLLSCCLSHPPRTMMLSLLCTRYTTHTHTYTRTCCIGLFAR